MQKRVTITVEIRNSQTGRRRSCEKTVMIPLDDGESIELAYVSTIDHSRCQVDTPRKIETTR